MTKFKFLLFVALLIGFGAFAHAGFDEGKATYDRALERGDYAEMRALADQGDAATQYNLGMAYLNGLGVPQDYAEAAKWLGKAADQGFAMAQYNLFILYANGQGVPYDYIQAYMWCSLAAMQGLQPAVQALSELNAIMTLSQIAEAQRIAREWKPKGQD
ncbi:MAG: tetratricopeptide repeat protein [Syntrophobacteraceae bacterium]|jgi:TPR repeat protein